MSSFGNPIGLAAEKDGRKKDALRLITEESLWMSICRTQESISGQIGESRRTSRRQCPHFGKRRLMNNIITMTIFF